MHSNIHQVQINTVCFHLYQVPRTIKFTESENTLIEASDWGCGVGKEDKELVFTGDRASVQEVEIFRRWMMMRVAQCQCTQCHRTVQLHMVKIACFILCDFWHNKNK